MDTGSQARTMDLSNFQQPYTETVDFNLITIRRPRDHDDVYLEKRRNGFRPVHIGELLKDVAYRILHKLGSGVHSVIWLAENLLAKPRYVAIKIFSLDCNEREINTEILRALNSARDDPLQPFEVQEGLHHLVKTLDHFTIPGPTNEHVCIVMELVGPSLQNRYVVSPGQPLPRPLLLAFASQLAKALLSLHHLGIVHGDLQPSNIALRFPFDAETLDVEGVYGKPEAILAEEYTVSVAEGFGPCIPEPVDPEYQTQHEDPPSEENSEASEDEDDYDSETEEDKKNTPKYYVLSSGLSKLSSAALQTRPSFQLVDFTCSFRPPSPGRIGSPLDFAPPEAHLPDLLGHLFSPASDMWTFGVLLFQLLDGKLLFNTFDWVNQRLPVRFYLDVARTLGVEDPIPEEFVQALQQCPKKLYLSEKGYYERDVMDRLVDFYKTGHWPSECGETCTYKGNMSERLLELREKKKEIVREEDGAVRTAKTATPLTTTTETPDLTSYISAMSNSMPLDSSNSRPSSPTHPPTPTAPPAPSSPWQEQELEMLCKVIEGCVRWNSEKRLTAKQVVDMLEKAGIRG